MRVAHFVHRYPPALGGSEAYFARLSRYLAAHGHQVTVFTSNARDLEAFWTPRAHCVPAGVIHEDGVEVHRYRLWRFRGRRYLLKPLSLLPSHTWQCLTLPCNPISFRMWRDAGKEDFAFDLVHATAFPYAFPIACARRLAHRLHVPFLVTPFLHLGDPAVPNDPTRRAYTSPALLSLLRTADRVFVQTRLERDALLERGFPKDRLVTLGMGVDLEECTGGDRARARQEWEVADNEVVIGHLANNSFEKGTVDLEQAVLCLWERHVRCSLVLAGPQMPNYKKMTNTLRCSGPLPRRGPIVGLGVLGERQKKNFFAGIDIFALPSRSDSFGIVLLEAWANGVPCVGYRAGGIAEVIRHGENGLLARCGDIDELSYALEELVLDERKRQLLGAAGWARVTQEMLWPDKLRRVEGVYAELTKTV